MHHTHLHTNRPIRPRLRLVPRVLSPTDDLPPSDLPPLVSLGMLRNPQVGHRIRRVEQVGVIAGLVLAALFLIGLALFYPLASQTILLAGILLIDTVGLIRLILRG